MHHSCHRDKLILWRGSQVQFLVTDACPRWSAYHYTTQQDISCFVWYSWARQAGDQHRGTETVWNLPTWETFYDFWVMYMNNCFHSRDIVGWLMIIFPWKCGLHFFLSASIFCIFVPYIICILCIFSCIFSCVFSHFGLIFYAVCKICKHDILPILPRSD